MENLRAVLELLYFTSGIFLVIIAGIGLRQLTIAKETAKMSSKRDAYKIASEQCELFLRTTVPLLNELDEAIADRGVQIFHDTHVEIVGKQFKIKTPSKGNFVSDVKKVATEFTMACNSLESISVFFTSGVAAEGIGFASIGHSFCASVTRLLPLLAPTAGSTHYRNILELFFLWNSRIEGEKLRLDKLKLEKRLETIDSKVIDPLGS